MRISPRNCSIYTTEELRLAYNALYEHSELTQMESYYLWIFALLSPTPGERFLDVACGRGGLMQVAKEKGYRIYGVDLSDVAVRSANIRLGSTLAIVADGEALPFPNNTFKFVTSLGSIEHYLHPDRGIAEIARVLSPTGKACILLPNSYSLLENIWRVLLTGDIGDQGQPIERYATRRQWERMLVENGLEIYKVIRYNFPFPRTKRDWWWYLKHPRKLLWLAISLFVPFNLSSCFVFLCRVRDKDSKIGEEIK